MRRLLKYLEQYKKESILAPIFKMSEALMDLFVPLVVAAVINHGLSGKNNAYITGNFILLLILAALGLVFSFTAQWFSAKASVGFATNLRQALFDHIQSFSYTELDTLGPDTLITRMTSDINQVQNGVNMTLRLLLRSPFIVFGSMIMAFTIDVRCALIFLAAIPVLSIVIFGIMRFSIPLFRKSQSALDVLLGKVSENLTGVRVIRAFCREEDEITEFDRQNEELTRLNIVVGRLSALMNPATYVLINIAAVILIRVGAIQVNAGSLRQGDVVALYNYMAQIIIELIKLANLIITINRSLACADRIADVLDIQPGMDYPAEDAQEQLAAAPAASVSNDPDHFSNDAVVFTGVTFSYRNAGAPALSDIRFRLKKGQTLGVIGGTGSGKSTLVNLIPRFYDATEGNVQVLGRDVRDYPEGELIKRIGMVPQQAVLFEGTIRDNLLWGNENASDEELWSAIRTAQAEDVVRGKEGMLEYRIEQNGRNLSGGQRQRLTIARALVRRPDILILDDSSSALDFATDLRLRRALHRLSDRMTMIIVSQRASSVRSADQILVLDDGSLAGSGTHAELMRSCRTYQEIYYSQFPEEKTGN